MDELATWLQKSVSQQTQDTQFPQYEQLDFGTGSFIFLNPNSVSTNQKVAQVGDDDELNVEPPCVVPSKYG